MNIGEYKLKSVFLQIDLVEGFLLVDRVGHLLKTLSKRFPKGYKVNVNPSKIILSNPDAQFSEINIDPGKIWVHSEKVKDLLSLITDFKDLTNLISNEIEVVEYGRIGIRLLLVKDMSKTNLLSIFTRLSSKSINLIKKNFLSDNVVTTIIHSLQLRKSREVNVILKPGAKDEKEKGSTYALIADIDFSQNKKTKIEEMEKRMAELINIINKKLPKFLQDVSNIK